MEKEKKKKEHNILGITLIAVLVLLIVAAIFTTVSYAFWQKTYEQNENNEIISSCFSYKLTENSSSIYLENTYPMSENDAMQNTPYSFTIENNCSTDIFYNVTLNTTRTSDLDPYLNYKLIDEASNVTGPTILSTLSTYDEYNNFTYTDEKGSYDILKSYILTTGTLNKAIMNSTNTQVITPGETKTYQLYIWMNENVEDISTMGKSFEGKIIVTGSSKDASEVETEGEVYGIKRRIDTTSSAWERIEDAQGLVAKAQVGNSVVQNDFDGIYPWNEIISYNYDTTSNKITAYYGDANFKFDGSNGEVLTKIPEFYYKREQDSEYEYIYITKGYKEGYIKSEEFSIGRYTMSGSENDVHSRSGYQPLTRKTITDFRNYAKALGNGFGQLDYHYFILQLLYLVEYADYNSQVKLGLGYTNSSHTEATTSGGCDSLGMHSGSADGTDNSSIIYRGVEDIFGNVWQFVDGINIKDYQAYICYDQNQYQTDKFDGCYQALGYTNATTTGYASKLGYDANHSLIAFPIEANGASTIYTTDYYFQTSTSQLIRVGGGWNNGLQSGFWLLATNTASSAYFGADSTARLLKTS